ncbi:MAG: hypothetical protein ACE5G0_06035 [Rhodothermales bacterium]
MPCESTVFVMKAPAFPLSLLLLVALVAGCGKKLDLDSTWRDQPITIDGSDIDWQGALQRVDKEDVSVGILNDDTHLYLCLVTGDRALQSQIIGRGFTLWFDPAGGKAKTFGIRFPLGMQGQRRAGGSPLDRQDPEMRRRRFEASLSELEIFGGGDKESHRLLVADVPGIEVKTTLAMTTLIYELKIPLQPSDEQPYAIGAEVGSAIGIGLETPEIDRDALRERLGGQRPGGGRGGGLGGRGSGRGGRGFGGRGGGAGRGGAQRPQMPGPLKIWTTVGLAPANAAAPASQ